MHVALLVLGHVQVHYMKQHVSGHMHEEHEGRCPRVLHVSIMEKICIRAFVTRLKVRIFICRAGIGHIDFDQVSV